MQYISPKNEYPRYYGDIQIEHPGWGLGDELPEGWVLVENATRPDFTEDEIAYEDFPIEVDGVMQQNWKVRPLTAEEIAFRDAPKTAKAKLIALGLTEVEIQALSRGLVGG